LRVADFTDSLYQEPFPSRLYHYTSLKGLLGILESGCIWASEVRYLNDSAEIAVAFRLMARVIGARRIRAPASRPALETLETPPAMTQSTQKYSGSSDGVLCTQGKAGKQVTFRRFAVTGY